MGTIVIFQINSKIKPQELKNYICKIWNGEFADVSTDKDGNLSVA
jgi:hypothetical protein